MMGGMRDLGWVLVTLAACGNDPAPNVRVGTVCPKSVIVELDDNWRIAHPFPGDNGWENATYFIGNTEVAAALDDEIFWDYSKHWGDIWHYKLHDETYTRNADNHAAGQVYLKLYERSHDPMVIEDLKLSIDNVIASGQRTHWSWIDAQFMASPVYAHLGEVTGDAKYQQAMFELYTDARDRRHLFDTTAGLWFRDENYLYPGATTPNGKKIFWARGNGWVIGSVVRTLEHLAPTSPYRADYEAMLRAMAPALAAVQREDGLWNVSLADPDDYGGPEASGTAFFLYGIAWGVNHGLLDRDTFAPVIERGWRGLVRTAMRDDGELGYVQGVGERPDSSQPVTLASTHDYGVGAFLLAGTEVMKLDLDLDCD